MPLVFGHIPPSVIVDGLRKGDLVLQALTVIQVLKYVDNNHNPTPAVSRGECLGSSSQRNNRQRLRVFTARCRIRALGPYEL